VIIKSQGYLHFWVQFKAQNKDWKQISKGQGLDLQGQGQGQGHYWMASRRLEAKAVSSRTPTLLICSSFPLKLKFQSSHRGIYACVRQYFLSSFTSSHLQWLGNSVSATNSKQAAHRKKNPFNVGLTCRRSKNVLSDEGQFVIYVHSVVPEFIVSEASEIASWWSSTSNMYLDTWLPSELEELPVPKSMLCYIVWAKNLNRFIGGGSAFSCELVQWEQFGSRALIAYFSDFLFVLVSDLFRYSLYIVFQNLFEYLYSFSIAFCFSFSISYSNAITFWFSISFS